MAEINRRGAGWISLSSIRSPAIKCFLLGITVGLVLLLVFGRPAAAQKNGGAGNHLHGPGHLGRLLELVKIPLTDTSRQNARMIEGEDTYDDIRRHARRWIAAHRSTVDGWLADAGAFQKFIRWCFPPRPYALSIFMVVLLLAAHIIWILERRENPQFPRNYPQGIWQSIWWA